MKKMLNIKGLATRQRVMQTSFLQTASLISVK